MAQLTGFVWQSVKKAFPILPQNAGLHFFGGVLRRKIPKLFCFANLRSIIAVIPDFLYTAKPLRLKSRRSFYEKAKSFFTIVDLPSGIWFVVCIMVLYRRHVQFFWRRRHKYLPFRQILFGFLYVYYL